jgi:hypothetical protein
MDFTQSMLFFSFIWEERKPRVEPMVERMLRIDVLGRENSRSLPHDSKDI